MNRDEEEYNAFMVKYGLNKTHKTVTEKTIID